MSSDRAPRRWLLILGVALVALNLRPAIASVGPLVVDIRAATGLSMGPRAAFQWARSSALSGRIARSAAW